MTIYTSAVCKHRLATLLGVSHNTLIKWMKKDAEAGRYVPPTTKIGTSKLIAIADCIRYAEQRGIVLSF